MRIAVISAMDNEHRQLTERLKERTEYKEGPFNFVKGKLGNNELILTQCGIGKVNAAMGSNTLIKSFQPDCVISTGVAGGIDRCMKVTDVVAGATFIYHDVWCGEGNEYGQVQGLPLVFKGNEKLIDYALSLNQCNHPSHIWAGMICTGDQFITNKEELQSIKNHFPQGLAVDMESTAIAQVCYLLQTPFLSFRIISDIPGDSNHGEVYSNFWSTLSERSFEITWSFLKNIPENLL